MKRKVVIGITDCEKYLNYAKWILAEPHVEVIQLGCTLSNADEIKKCNGVLLTGGEDIHPRFYDKEIHYQNAPPEFEEERDEFEFEIFKRAQESKLPILGICRGLQLINCIFGGTLRQDLGQLNATHKRISKEDKVHLVNLEPATLLNGISNVAQGNVNSSHHQAIDKLGDGLKINCYAADGTIEGIESSESDHSFLLAVQWHPERMMDQNSPLAKNIKLSFLDHASKLS